MSRYNAGMHRSEPDRASTVSTLYSLIAALTMISFVLGADISEMVNRRGSQESMSLHGVSICLAAGVAIPILAVAIHKSIQRLFRVSNKHGDSLV